MAGVLALLGALALGGYLCLLYTSAFEGQVLAVAERNSAYAIAGEEAVTGNVMQFCLDYGEGGEERVTRAYNTRREGATLLIPLGPCEYSPLMADLIDRYGVRWCLFV